MLNSQERGEQSPASPNQPISQSLGRQAAVCREGPRLRCLLYIVCLTFLSAPVLFNRLGDGMLQGDEAIYAQVIETMVQSGDWLFPHRQAYDPYLKKPPLYFWLTASTWRLFADSETALRVWSALFGLGCVLLTGWLGMLLFGPETGLLAGLFLATNKLFLYAHGARDCGFDAALTFFALACYLLWWRVRSARPWTAWALIGAAVGAACMLKPLVGLPILAILAGYDFFAGSLPTCGKGLPSDSLPPWGGGLGWGVQPSACDNHSPLSHRLARPVLALAVCALSAGPWHLVQWLRYGDAFPNAIFWVNYVERATSGIDQNHVQGPLYYLTTLSTSSAGAFYLALPALAFCTLVGCRGANRKPYSFLAVVAGLYILLYSLSSSKLVWYLYPVYPLIALAIAVLVEQGVPQVLKAFHGSRLISVLVAGIVLWQAVQCIRYALNPRTPPSDRPWNLYKKLEEAVASGEVHFIGYRLLHPDGRWRWHTGFDRVDTYYWTKMKAATWVTEVDQLKTVLADQRPAYVFVPLEEDIDELKRRVGPCDPERVRFIRGTFQSP